ncbi:MAG: class I SAM-dependent methyltransferase [Methylococcales bacterium]
MFLIKNRDVKQRFSDIYTKNRWKNPESASGFGSTFSATRQARDGLQQLIVAHEIRTILDAPCGDFNWFQMIDFNGDYIGVDVVEELITNNLIRHGNNHRKFMSMDIIREKLPLADLVLCRECLNHLSLLDGIHAINNLIASTNKLLVLTHYPDLKHNIDQPASFRYRQLNFTLSPFFLRQPDFLIDESDTEPGKFLAVFDIRKAPIKFIDTVDVLRSDQIKRHNQPMEL